MKLPTYKYTYERICIPFCKPNNKTSQQRNCQNDLNNMLDFIILLNSNNCQNPKQSRIKSLSSAISTKLRLKTSSSKFFFGYLANYFLLRRHNFSFNKETAGCMEKIIQENIASISNGQHLDCEYLLFLLIIVHEMFMQSFFIQEKLFSKRFLRFFAQLDFLFDKTNWASLYLSLYSQTVQKGGLFYFSDCRVKDVHSDDSDEENSLETTSYINFDLKSFMLKKRSSDKGAKETNRFFEKILNVRKINKSALNSKETCLSYLMQIAFFSLKQSHQQILSNFIYVNKSVCGLQISILVSISEFMESQISSVYKTNNPNFNMDLTPTLGSCVEGQSQDSELSGAEKIKLLRALKIEKLKIVFPMILNFLNFESNKNMLTCLSLLHPDISSFITKLKVKYILRQPAKISIQKRMFLYKKLIAATEQKDSLEDLYQTTKRTKSLSIIKMDVERTNFFHGDLKELESLLEDLDKACPKIGYYQGLNCIGAFCLDYFKDYCFSFEIIKYLMAEYLEKYFCGDFKFLNTLVFIGESLIKEHFPQIFHKVEASGIGHSYYLSSIILTIYFNILQVHRCEHFIIECTDLMLAEGWTGFYKVWGLLLFVNI